MRRWIGAIVVVLAALAAGACGSTSDRAQRMTLAALELPSPKPTPAPSAPEVSCAHPYASLRPPAVMPTPGAMPTGSFMAQIERRGYLRVGVDQNTLLFAYVNPLDGRLEGFEIDMLRQIARAIFGNPNAIRFVALTTSERLPAVENGSVDAVADAVTITCARRKEVDFSTVYYDASQKLLVPLNSPIHSLKDLAGRRVCATIGSTTIETVTHEAPRSVPYPVPQRTDCLVALQEGLVDAISSDDSILLGFKAQDPYTKIVGPSIAPEPYGMAINRAHPDFVRFVNGVLATIRTNGTWRAIYAKWLGRFNRPPAAPRPQYAG